ALDAAGKPPALRIQRNLWEAWINLPAVQALVSYAEDYEDDRTHLWELIENILADQTADESTELKLPDWLSKCLSSIPRIRSTRIDIHPAKGLILSSRRRSRIAAEPDLFADDDDLTSIAGEELSLRAHTKAVVNAVRKITGRCLPKEFQPLLEL